MSSLISPPRCFAEHPEIRTFLHSKLLRRSLLRRSDALACAGRAEPAIARRSQRCSTLVVPADISSTARSTTSICPTELHVGSALKMLLEARRARHGMHVVASVRLAESTSNKIMHFYETTVLNDTHANMQHNRTQHAPSTRLAHGHMHT